MTQNYIITREQFETVKKTWAESKYHSAGEHIIYNLLRSKVPTLGFVERKSNIQGCDSWFAFKTAKHDVIRAYFRHKMFARATQTESEAKFKQRFGIDMPEGFYELLIAVTV